ncbi:hypothetical protein H9P43_009968 [Blastocladiella emersonii ATCC 22665]|nr:hypothetical protein H9P43_009968 [Blastocladiella emersonii ATCC 22665]
MDDGPIASRTRARYAQLGMQLPSFAPPMPPLPMPPPPLSMPPLSMPPLTNPTPPGTDDPATLATLDSPLTSYAPSPLGVLQQPPATITPSATGTLASLANALNLFPSTSTSPAPAPAAAVVELAHPPAPPSSGLLLSLEPPYPAAPPPSFLSRTLSHIEAPLVAVSAATSAAVDHVIPAPAQHWIRAYREWLVLGALVSIYTLSSFEIVTLPFQPSDESTVKLAAPCVGDLCPRPATLGANAKAPIVQPFVQPAVPQPAPAAAPPVPVVIEDSLPLPPKPNLELAPEPESEPKPALPELIIAKTVYPTSSIAVWSARVFYAPHACYTYSVPTTTTPRVRVAKAPSPPPAALPVDSPAAEVKRPAPVVCTADRPVAVPVDDEPVPAAVSAPLDNDKPIEPIPVAQKPAPVVVPPASPPGRPPKRTPLANRFKDRDQFITRPRPAEPVTAPPAPQHAVPVPAGFDRSGWIAFATAAIIFSAIGWQFMAPTAPAAETPEVSDEEPVTADTSLELDTSDLDLNSGYADQTLTDDEASRFFSVDAEPAKQNPETTTESGSPLLQQYSQKKKQDSSVSLDVPSDFTPVPAPPSALTPLTESSDATSAATAGLLLPAAAPRSLPASPSPLMVPTPRARKTSDHVRWPAQVVPPVLPPPLRAASRGDPEHIYVASPVNPSLVPQGLALGLSHAAVVEGERTTPPRYATLTPEREREVDALPTPTASPVREVPANEVFGTSSCISDASASSSDAVTTPTRSPLSWSRSSALGSPARATSSVTTTAAASGAATPLASSTGSLDGWNMVSDPFDPFLQPTVPSLVFRRPAAASPSADSGSSPRDFQLQLPAPTQQLPSMIPVPSRTNSSSGSGSSTPTSTMASGIPRPVASGIPRSRSGTAPSPLSSSPVPVHHHHTWTAANTAGFRERSATASSTETVVAPELSASPPPAAPQLPPVIKRASSIPVLAATIAAPAAPAPAPAPAAPPAPAPVEDEYREPTAEEFEAEERRQHWNTRWLALLGSLLDARDASVLAYKYRPESGDRREEYKLLDNETCSVLRLVDLDKGEPYVAHIYKPELADGVRKWAELVGACNRPAEADHDGDDSAANTTVTSVSSYGDSSFHTPTTPAASAYVTSPPPPPPRTLLSSPTRSIASSTSSTSSLGSGRPPSPTVSSSTAGGRDIPALATTHLFSLADGGVVRITPGYRVSAAQLLAHAEKHRRQNSSAISEAVLWKTLKCVARTLRGILDHCDRAHEAEQTAAAEAEAAALFATPPPSHASVFDLESGSGSDADTSVLSAASTQRTVTSAADTRVRTTVDPADPWVRGMHVDLAAEIVSDAKLKAGFAVIAILPAPDTDPDVPVGLSVARFIARLVEPRAHDNYWEPQLEGLISPELAAALTALARATTVPLVRAATANVMSQAAKWHARTRREARAAATGRAPPTSPTGIPSAATTTAGAGSGTATPVVGPGIALRRIPSMSGPGARLAGPRAFSSSSS